jgi:nucleoside phosphorylase
MKTLIFVAMEKETPDLIDRLGLLMASEAQQLPKGLDSKVYYRCVGEHHIWLTLSGKDPHHRQTDCIGSLIQLALYASIEKFKPDTIINAGTAGAIYAEGAKKHQVYLGSTAMSHDLHFPESDVEHRKLAIGDYPVPDESALALELGFEWMPLSTTGSMLTTEDDKKQLKENKAKLVDMEWKDIVHVILRCDYKPRYMALKVTTDFIDTGDCPQEQFNESMSNSGVMKLLAEACQKVIESICHIQFNEYPCHQPGSLCFLSKR